MNPQYATTQQQFVVPPVEPLQQRGQILNQAPHELRSPITASGNMPNGAHTETSSGNMDQEDFQNRTREMQLPLGQNNISEQLVSQIGNMNISGQNVYGGNVKPIQLPTVSNAINGEPSQYYPSVGTNINHLPPHMPPPATQSFTSDPQLQQRPSSINGSHANNTGITNRSTPSQLPPQVQMLNQQRQVPFSGQLPPGPGQFSMQPGTPQLPTNSAHLPQQDDYKQFPSKQQLVSGQSTQHSPSSGKPLPGLNQIPNSMTQYNTQLNQGVVGQPRGMQMPPGRVMQPGQSTPQQLPISGQLPNQRAQPQGQYSPMHGQLPPMTGQLPPMSGQLPPMPGNLPPMPNQSQSMSNHMPGQIPPMSGQMPPMPGQMPPMPGQMPPMPGQMPPMAGQMPPMPGQMPPMPGQMPPMPGQMPSMASQMPPMPGHMGYSPASGPYSQQGGFQQPQQAKRLDPDQMPSPIQVTNDDQRNRSGEFCTNQKGLVPPLVTTVFTTQDQGNSGPRYIRSSMYNVPITIDMMKQTSVPFGLVISPLAKISNDEAPPPIVNLGELGPVRCIRCKAYMCPFMQFIDSGRRFQCLFCKATTEVPAEYFQHLDHTGQRLDRFERPELMLGTYEFIATKDYCRNNTYPKPPAVIFVIDVSYNNIKSGLVNLLCSEMKNIIRNLPEDNGAKANMKVGFITYNNTVHFYNVKGNLAQPQMLVVGDIQEMFMPLLDGFLCDPEESESVIDSLMQQIPAMFADTRETETILAPAIQAGLEALKASECAGKLLVFHSSLPIAEAPGKLKNRDDRKVLGTDKEKTILTPQCTTYNNLGQDCVGAGCSVDLFLFNNSYVDVATIGQVARLTGGEIFKYTYFQADLDGERLIEDVINDISRPIAFDSIMRVRTSTGVRPTDFYGHFFMSNTTDMELASIDCDKAVAIEIKHDDKLTEEEGVYIQVALLYTSCGGQRRLRIHNLSLKTCSQMADLYRSCDLDTIINFFSKQAMFKMMDSSPKAFKDALINRCAQMLACYRKNCASPSSAGQLILPECMKLLPLYVNCLLKSDAVSGGSDMTVDDRSFVMHVVCIMDLPSSVGFFYPRLLSLHDIDSSETEIPPPIRCSMDKMTDDGAFLLENGVHMFLWIGLNLSSEWVQAVFGVPSAVQVDTDKTKLPVLENQLSYRIRSIISTIRKERHRCMRLTLVRQREKLEVVFKHFLVEDRGTDGSPSYVDFLCHMHKEIRMLLS